MNFYDDQQHDHQLVQRARAGDHRSFNTLIEKYHAAAWAQAYGWVKNPTDTQDILQIAFLRSYQNLSQLTDPERFPSWLREIIVNVCKMHIRGHKSLINIDTQNEIQLGITVNNQAQITVETQETHAQLDQILDTLPNGQAILIRLFYFSGFSYRQIARFLDLPITTIESRLYKARQKLNQPHVRNILENLANTPIHILEKGRPPMDKVVVKLGDDLIPLCKTEIASENLIDQISALRKQLSTQQQLFLPPVRVRDWIELPKRAYQIHIEENIVFEGKLEETETADKITQQLAKSVEEHADQF